MRHPATLRLTIAALALLAWALVITPGRGSIAAATPAVSTSASESTLMGSVVVGVSPGGSFAAAASVKGSGATVRVSDPAAGILVVAPPRGRGARDLATGLAGRSGVRYAEPVREVRACSTPDDPGYAAQWNLHRVGAPAAWNVTSGKASVKVAVVDSGIDLGHPDLAGRIDTLNDRDFIEGDYSAMDRNGHGTHVAGIIAANADNGRDIAGIASGVTLLPVRVLDAYGAGDTVGLALGIRWAADRGARVINVSAGTTYDSQVLADAVQYALAKGCLVVAAAGNRGGYGLQYPAAYADVLSVGSSDYDDQRAAFSQYGGGLDLVAPGVGPGQLGILSLLPATGTLSGASTGYIAGTSMSAPHVSAAAALLFSTGSGWNAATVTHRLLVTAQDVGAPGRDAYTGYGLVRIDRALGIGWPAASALSDDGYPGIPLYSSRVSNVVATSFDPMDVRVVTLEPGQLVRVAFRGTAGARTSLSLYGPTQTALSSAVPLRSVVSTGQAALLAYRVPLTGRGSYRIVVKSLAGGGAYSYVWRRAYESYAIVSAPTSCEPGDSVTVTGRVARRSTGRVMDGVRVYLDEFRYGSSAWRAGVGTDVSDEDGRVWFEVTPRRRTYYRIRYAGSALAYPVVSRTVAVSPQ